MLEITFDSLLLCVIFKAIQLITQINEINYEKNVKCVGAGFGEQLNQLVNNWVVALCSDWSLCRFIIDWYGNNSTLFKRIALLPWINIRYDSAVVIFIFNTPHSRAQSHCKRYGLYANLCCRSLPFCFSHYVKKRMFMHKHESNKKTFHRIIIKFSFCTTNYDR